ncbi:hypothetical protein CI109_103794 [Kwoniella shandongensis]|uniref:Uncharacterized protein n=1 Tax=Kwoniella shandongensis TaxID=1734106 RepID=A0AAJ8LL95_9TREE
MSSPKPAHFVVVPQAMWGHVRPILQLSLNLVTLHPHLHLTLLLAPSVKPRVEQELKSLGLSLPKGDASESETIMDRVQIIDCISNDFHLPEVWHPATMLEEAINYGATLPAFIKLLYGGGADEKVQGVVNKWTGIEPTAVMFDSFQHFVPAVVKGVVSSLGRAVPHLLAFGPSNAVSVFHMFASEKSGGLFEKVIRLANEEMAKGMDSVAAYDKYAFVTDGSVSPLPGLPTKYDFPLFATIGLPPGTFSALAPSYYSARDEAVTGFVLPTNEELEPVAVAALEQELGKKVYMTGLQFADNIWNGGKPSLIGGDADDERVLSFLDRMKEKHGSKSVCYVSFGSLFFPILRPELIH